MTARGAGPGGRRWVTTDERPKERGRHQPDRCSAPPVAADRAHDLHPSGPFSKDRSLIEGHVQNSARQVLLRDVLGCRERLDDAGG